ncbi:MAG: hypothetical protein KAU28_02610, partial [Phycisphaerae bacterium]|nr:hypothetical protein [Phycisphaerae bacterium]
MSLTDRLLKVGSIADSMGVYVPAMALQKAIGLGRMVLFAYVLTKVQYGLWALGVMIFGIGAPLLTLGSSHGLVRYVSYYEARGQLREFYRRIRWCILALAVGLTGLAFVGSGFITDLVILSKADTAAHLAYDQQKLLCAAALANAMFLALHHNMLGFMYGLRTYRLVSVIEVFFAVVFTALGAGTLLFEKTGLALCVAHGVTLVATIMFGVVLLRLAVRRLGALAVRARDTVVATPDPDTEEVITAVDISSLPKDGEAEPAGGALRRVLHYGLPALFGTLLWQFSWYVSFWLTNKKYGKEYGSVYSIFLLLGQPIVFLANAAWAVIFTHVARRWESGQRQTAMFVLEAAYKAVAVVMMTLAIMVYASAPLWVKILPEKYHQGQELLGGLLLFFQALTHLAIMTMLAKLMERPIVIALAAAAVLAVNVTLAGMWMGGDAAAGMIAASRAAGVGMYVGAGVVAIGYFIATRVKLHVSTYFVMASPALLLLDVRVAAVIWAAILAAATLTPWLFDPRQK